MPSILTVLSSNFFVHFLNSGGNSSSEWNRAYKVKSHSQTRPELWFTISPDAWRPVSQGLWGGTWSVGSACAGCSGPRTSPSTTGPPWSSAAETPARRLAHVTRPESWHQRCVLFEKFRRLSVRLTFQEETPGIHFSPGRSAELSASSSAPDSGNRRKRYGLAGEQSKQFIEQINSFKLTLIWYFST